ncbi:hypothetical protein MERGE_001646 [Pneumocystis wakefieldiae]|uniref:Indoleamine 2,3-dioxygenase n=1 Tax=Pneumocystis wakefieldiae TaxID=38082 RepID=A0A899FVH2_9ASCO|nr:hypothetical protein MERGE_001646 [Pneumocystis wakefieldiae]
MDIQRFISRLQASLAKLSCPEAPELAKIRANAKYVRKLILRAEDSGQNMRVERQEIEGIIEEIEEKQREKEDTLEIEEEEESAENIESEVTEEILIEHRKMADEMTQEMLRLAQEMKVNARAMGEIAERDQSLILSTGNILGKNLNIMQITNKRLEKYRRVRTGTFFISVLSIRYRDLTNEWVVIAMKDMEMRVPCLEDYGLSERTGFLPDKEPLARLTKRYYEPWEEIMDHYSDYILMGRFRRVIDDLPILSVEYLDSLEEKQRGYLILSFMAHSYTWDGERPSDRLPASIAKPWVQVSENLEIRPVISYAAVCLWNWRRPFPNEPMDLSNLIRPYLSGWKNMADIGLPKGVIYEGCSEDYRQYSGGSNGQSPLIQLLDIALGINHRPTEMISYKANACSASVQKKSNFFQEMREYMPGSHRRFLQDLEKIMNIRQFCLDNSNDSDVISAYNACVTGLKTLRDKHLQVVSRYIIIQSRAQHFGNKNYKKNSMNIGLARHVDEKVSLKGTGGTNLISFLKQFRNETTSCIIKSTTNSVPLLESYSNKVIKKNSRNVFSEWKDNEWECIGALCYV